MPDDPLPAESPAASADLPAASSGSPGLRDRPDPLAPFRWHPEPELLGVLDPARSRASLERLGTAAWSTALDYLYDEALRRSVGEPIDYPSLRRRYYGPTNEPGPPPSAPTPSDALLERFRTRLAPHQLNAWHPRTLSYFTPAPLVASIVGELLAQWTNQGVDVWHCGPVGAFVEEEVVRWLCGLVGYGPGSFGLLTSGGVMANFIALTLVRDIGLRRALGLDHPPRGAALEGVRVYVSDQGHFSIGRALDELGFPAGTLVAIPSDGQFRLGPAGVAAAIAADRARGLRPLAVVAVAGTTNTGSVDDVPGLGALAAREGLWFHVDAAYGAAVRFSARDRDRVPGLHLADTITIDPHKWLFQAYDIGGLLVRDGTTLGPVFGATTPEYYRGGDLSGNFATAPADVDDHAVPDRHGAPDQLNFWKLGFEGTRRWRALKLWFSWHHLGTEGFGRLVEQTNDLAAGLAARVAASDDFEACPAVPELSVVCFRHLPGGADAARAWPPAALDAHQDRLAAALEASGDGWLSTTTLRGRTYLRAGIVNYLTTPADLDRLLDRLRRLAG